MHRFLVNGQMEVSAQIALDAEESKHALKVLRLSEGDGVELSNGEGQLFAGKIVSVQNDIAVCEALQALDNREAPVSVTVYMGLSKFDKTEFVAQKATELGAKAIVPVIMQRSVARYDERDAEKKQVRMEKICAEATKQCGRACVPFVSPAIPFAKALPMLHRHELMLMPWEESKDGTLKEIYAAHPNAADIGILIGPEGGITEKEAKDSGATLVTLGKRILRAETAAVAALAMVMQLWGDM